MIDGKKMMDQFAASDERLQQLAAHCKELRDDNKRLKRELAEARKDKELDHGIVRKLHAENKQLKSAIVGMKESINQAEHERDEARKDRLEWAKSMARNVTKENQRLREALKRTITQ